MFWMRRLISFRTDYGVKQQLSAFGQKPVFHQLCITEQHVAETYRFLHPGNGLDLDDLSQTRTLRTRPWSAYVLCNHTCSGPLWAISLNEASRGETEPNHRSLSRRHFSPRLCLLPAPWFSTVDRSLICDLWDCCIGLTVGGYGEWMELNVEWRIGPV